jgi:hypothetical protein
VSVLKDGGPIKTALQNLRSGLLCTEVASTCMILTEGDDAGLVRLVNASPNDLIGTILEQVRIVPEKILHHGHKFGLILPSPMQRHLTGDKIVHYFSKPWQVNMSNMHQLLIGEGLRNGGGFFREVHRNPREMISHHVFETLIVPNLNVELL